ncbi:Nudix hydrolase 14 chloroplastic [Zea mays]|uniref:Nudix hydrolase 14 chloroplastic n=1 Tax=Zea mays TaxID=4577 RepID=A0A1D6NW96_MAIZE|nr:Nudix hydrolase 14 chloroplastic [Zea mays]
MASEAAIARAQCLLRFRRWSPLPLLPLPSPPATTRAASCRRSVRMASSDGSAAALPSATVDVPGAGAPVLVVGAPGLPEADFRNAVESSLFKQWLRNLQSEKGVLTYGRLSLTRVLIQGVDMFGKRVGFLKFKADIVDEETKTKVPGIVFARGPAVAVLILLESNGETYAVLTEQVRVPIGKFLLELPAGMLDDEKGDFVGTAVREVSILASEYACTEICVLMQDSQHCIYPVFARFWSRLHRL